MDNTPERQQEVINKILQSDILEIIVEKFPLKTTQQLFADIQAIS
jgi:hypothetical protein